MREPRYSILSDINDGIDRAKQGKLALYWQRNIEPCIALLLVIGLVGAFFGIFA